MADSWGGVILAVGKKKSRAGRPRVPEPRKSIASFRGSDAFAAWFEALVRRERISAANLIERALVYYAQHGLNYEVEAPER